MKTAIGFYLILLIGFSSHAFAQCATELKPTDGFKELSAVLRCLQSEIDTLKKSANPATKGETPSPARAATATVDTNVATFELGECSSKAGSLDCRVFVTPKGSDLSLNFGQSGAAPTRAIDAEGVTYAWHGFKTIGEARTEDPRVCCGVKRSFVADVRGGVHFTLVSQSGHSSRNLAAIQIAFLVEESQNVRGRRTSDWQTITFRNISVR